MALLDPARLLCDCGQAGNGSLLGCSCSLYRLRLGPQHGLPLPLPQLTMQLLVLCLHQHTFPFHLQSHCLLGEDETSCCVNGFVSRQLPALDQHGNISWDQVGDAGRHEPCLCGVSMLPKRAKHMVLQSDSGNFCTSVTVAYRCWPAWQPTQTGHGVQRCRWLFAVKYRWPEPIQSKTCMPAGTTSAYNMCITHTHTHMHVQGKQGPDLPCGMLVAQVTPLDQHLPARAREAGPAAYESAGLCPSWLCQHARLTAIPPFEVDDLALGNAQEQRLGDPLIVDVGFANPLHQILSILLRTWTP